MGGGPKKQQTVPLSTAFGALASGRQLCNHGVSSLALSTLLGARGMAASSMDCYH